MQKIEATLEIDIHDSTTVTVYGEIPDDVDIDDLDIYDLEKLINNGMGFDEDVENSISEDLFDYDYDLGEITVIEDFEDE